MAGSVLVFTECRAGEPTGSSLQAVTAAAGLARALDRSLSAVVLGSDARAAAHAVGRRGVPQVFVVEDAALDTPNTEALATALAAVAKECSPDVVVLAGTVLGRDVASALAAQLGAPVVSDAVSLAVDGDQLTAVRPVYAGKVRITVAVRDRPVVVSVRPKSHEPAAEREAEVSVTAVSVDLSGVRCRVREVKAPEVRTVSLTEADVVVSGGRGMKGPEHFDLIEDLAEALGGAVGASRAVVDAGWRPHSEQVGQTGKTVAPRLYMACAISGAIQHLAGMTSSRCIVAVNKDPDAPIFKVADYGIVGDVFEVLPALLSAIRERKG